MIPEGLEKTQYELEMGLVKTDKDPFRLYRGMCVDVLVPNSRMTGVYRGLTNDGICILAPHLNFSPQFREEQKSVPSIWEVPVLVRIEHIMCMRPADYPALERLVNEERERISGGPNIDPACLI